MKLLVHGHNLHHGVVRGKVLQHWDLREMCHNGLLLIVADLQVMLVDGAIMCLTVKKVESYELILCNEGITYDTAANIENQSS